PHQGIWGAQGTGSFDVEYCKFAAKGFFDAGIGGIPYRLAACLVFYEPMAAWIPRPHTNQLERIFIRRCVCICHSADHYRLPGDTRGADESGEESSIRIVVAVA